MASRDGAPQSAHRIDGQRAGNGAPRAATETSDARSSHHRDSKVQLASFEGGSETLPRLDSPTGGRVDDVDAPKQPPAGESEAIELLPPPAATAISLEDVVSAVYASYPSLDAVSRERQIAAAEQLAAMGQFDVNLVGESIAQPMGYYKNYRSGIGFKQYTWGGGETFTGYRIGRGYFEPWYKERQTNDGGEFKTGFAVPFLRDRAIDKRRAAVFQAQLNRRAAEPKYQAEVIETVLAASITYWDWVAAGQRARIARQMLDLATERQAGMEKRAARGDIAGIELVDNERTIVARRTKQVEAELKLQQSAIKLSLYLRDPAGTPLLADADQLPREFPEIKQPIPADATELIEVALDRRPELRLLQLDQQSQELKMQQAANLSLPAFDGLMTASQDVGAPYSPLRDKSPFELEAGVVLDVPLQRRQAQGDFQAAREKLAQIGAKRRYAEQSIAAEVQSALAGIDANLKAIANAREAADLARQVAEAERKKLAQGDSNVLNVNLRELATAEADLLVVDSELNYRIALAMLHAATAGELAAMGAATQSDQSADERCL